MTAQSFTPGPWSFAHRKTAESMYATEVFCAKGATIATFTWYPMPTTPKGVTATYREGNARLCATAPELLSELINMTARFKAAVIQAGTDEEFAEHAVASARAAIAKATGGAA